jgi:predicted SAM-dependent methyltransferase
MLSRGAKAAFYNYFGPLMTLNGQLHRIRYRLIRPTDLKVHLGPGQRKYLKGWLNCDANFVTAKCDLWLNLDKCLPFPENSVSSLYSHHVVEHLADLRSHFRDVHRVLQKNGVYRIGFPNADKAMEMYQAGRSDWFGDWPDKFNTPGGKLNNFLICRGEHVQIITQQYIREVLSEVGFRNIVRCTPAVQTEYPSHFAECLGYEDFDDVATERTMVIEAEK